MLEWSDRDNIIPKAHISILQVRYAENMDDWYYLGI